MKTRLQLQGELQARGQHAVHYRHTLHAFYTIARNDGILALQKGIVPALWFQVFLNGTRLGTYGKLENLGFTRKNDGSVSVSRTILVSATGGCLGSYMASPLYLVKTHMQSKAATNIAVGHQHSHTGTISALTQIYQREGVRGLWRGSVSSLPRIAVGSATQLSTFSKTKEFLENHEILREDKSLLNTFAASMISGAVVAVFMTPFDVVQTRLYNQGVDANGKGLFYSSIPDCFIKMWRTEGIFGFFKGLGPCYLRIGPHTVLTLLFFDLFNKLHQT